ncbi:hypothetical protein WICMUC_005123 [Wickerhamomyces mucosus]|uniref:Uncharacterized protein n=1 Tax=Wickerhamomyces mucosus TaxID=1378264 RepID=A0A9P8PCM5_9ASCO|nr:hypothetical protein WICMUC_005123 [Wickerhamomyces mucosus]
MVKSIKPRDFNFGKFRSSVISSFLFPDKFKYLKLWLSFQFHSYLLLEVLYFKSLEPTSINSKFLKLLKSDGSVRNLLPFKNSNLKGSILSKSSGRDVKALPDKKSCSKLVHFDKVPLGISKILLYDKDKIFKFVKFLM